MGARSPEPVQERDRVLRLSDGSNMADDSGVAGAPAADSAAGVLAQVGP